MTVGAVIVTFQTPADTLAACLASLQQNGCHHSIVIANDPAPEIRTTAARYHARYQSEPVNRGFAAAANRGAALLKTNLLLFLNPDAALESHAVSRASGYLAAQPSCGIVGLLLISPRGVTELRAFGSPVTPLSLFTRHLVSAALPQLPRPVGWVSGGALLIRRRLFMQLRGFDERFFLYWEDVDLCRRASDLGQQTVLLPAARAVHQRGASLQDSALKTALYDDSADKYFRKYYAPTICRCLRFLRSLYRLCSPQAQ